MGYTHYWRRRGDAAIIRQDIFADINNDIKKIVAQSEETGIRIRNGLGRGEPEFKPDHFSINGDGECGHQETDLGITWPAKQAQGVGQGAGATAQAGVWFAGALLATRTCGGDCSHESFYIDRIVEHRKGIDDDGDDWIFDFCKTAYKPYDITATASLILLSSYFDPDILTINSDGEPDDWKDGKRLCVEATGKGWGFNLPDWHSKEAA